MAESATQEHVFEHLRTRSLREGNVVVYVLEGSLDASNLPQFENTVIESCNAQQAKVLLDCSGLTHLSSSGIGSFYRFFNACRSSGGAFSICAVPDRIQAVLDLVGLTRVLKPAENRAAAIELLASAEASA